MTAERPHVCPPDHRHGETSTCYNKHGCRDLACRLWSAADARRLKALRREGVALFVDAAPVRAHLLLLQKSGGLSLESIAALSGVHSSTVWRILRGRSSGDAPQLVQRARAEALFAVPFTAIPEQPEAHVDARGSRRRLQALGALGWTGHRLAPMLGLSRQTITRIMQEGSRVSVATAATIAELYDRLSLQLPTSSTPYEAGAIVRVRKYAAAHGWALPLEWDDIDTDEQLPAATGRAGADVDEVAVELACDGVPVRLNYLERVEAVRRLNRQGIFDPEIAARIRLDVRSIVRIRTRNGIPAAESERAAA